MGAIHKCWHQLENIKTAKMARIFWRLRLSKSLCQRNEDYMQRAEWIHYYT